MSTRAIVVVQNAKLKIPGRGVVGVPIGTVLTVYDERQGLGVVEVRSTGQGGLMHSSAYRSIEEIADDDTVRSAKAELEPDHNPVPPRT